MCSKAAMIIKTKSGIKRLYPVISPMEQAIEPGHVPVPADDNDTIAEAAEEPAEGSV